jgi:predicted transcriptional regulator
MENQEPKNPFVSIHTPIALVALALSVLFFSQIKSLGNATETVKWQSNNVDKQIASYKDANEKLLKAIAERAPAVKESSSLQMRFGKLIKKVNELSKGDEKDETVKDAKNIISILVSSGINSINVPDDPADQKK